MLEKGNSSKRQKLNGCSFQQVLRPNLNRFLYYHWETLSQEGFILKSAKRAWFPLENGTGGFQNNPLFKCLACFMCQCLKIFNIITLKQIF